MNLYKTMVFNWVMYTFQMNENRSTQEFECYFVIHLADTIGHTKFH